MEEGRHTLSDGRVVEAGTTDIGINWKGVGLNADFEDTPTVVTQAMSYNGGNPIVTRQKNVHPNGFHAKLQESQQRAGQGHATEDLGYIAFEQGGGDSGHVGNTGARIEENWAETEFSTSMDDPALLASAQTYNGGDAGALRINNLDGNSVHTRFQEGTTQDKETNHAHENVGIAALDNGLLHSAPDADPVDVKRIGEVGETRIHQQNDGQWHTVDLKHTYDDPVVVAGPVGPHGGQAAMTRMKDVGGGNFKIQVEEWANLDGAHAPVDVGYTVIESGRHELDSGRIVEAGKTAIDDNWKNINLKSNFEGDPTVVSQAMTMNGGNRIAIRQKSVDQGNFHARLQEYNNGGHANETLGYIAFDRGGGGNGDVGVSTDVNDHWTETEFATDVEDPVMLATPHTYNGGDPGTVRFNNLDKSSAHLRFQEETRSDDETNHAHEDIGYAALETGTLFAQVNDGL